jgi:peptide/nickel transport system substrate-binding protein
MALDRQAIIDEALEGQALVLQSPIPPPSWAHYEGVPTYEHDPEAAKGLLDSKGWYEGDGDGTREREGQRLEFSILTNDDPARMRIISLISQQLAEVGIRANPQVASAANLVPEFLRHRRFDALLYEWRAPLPDPDPYPMWHSTQAADGGQNYPGYENREVDQLLEQARHITDQEVRRRLYSRFQEIFAQEVPSLLLYSQVYSYAIDDAVKDVQIGFLVDPGYRFRNISQWYVKTKRLEVASVGS